MDIREAEELSYGYGPGGVRDVIRWRPPSLDLVVSIDLGEVFAGLA
ncbi:MAG TPA: hypothetical protein VF118_00335 [Gemmatimonadaceae bacterium]